MNTLNSTKEPSSKKKKQLTLKKLQNAIDEYFSECDSATKEIYIKSSGTIEEIKAPCPYTLEGLSLATNISREQLLHFELYETNAKLINMINRAKLRIQENIINRALDGESNATMTAFILKNNFGYKEKTEQEFNGKEGEAILSSIHVKIIKTKDELNNE